jgi:protein-tyrosine phosphatase
VRVLFVCTANICRSPMAAAFLIGGRGDRRVGFEVASAGLLPGGRVPPPEVVETMDAYGLDVRGHRSRQLTADMLGPADLILGMGRRHVQEAVLLDGAVWPRAFTLKEFVRRGEAVGPRPDRVPIRSWLQAVHAGRTRTELAGRSSTEEVADPFGGPLEGYRETGAELGALVNRLSALLRPDVPSPLPPPIPVPELVDPTTLEGPAAGRH